MFFVDGKGWVAFSRHIVGIDPQASLRNKENMFAVNITDLLLILKTTEYSMSKI